MVQNKEDYNVECMRLLGDSSTYKKLRGDPSGGVVRDLKEWIESFQNEETLSDKEKSYLVIEYPSIPVFYTLPKVHKSLTSPPGRPIVSGVKSVTSNLSEMIDYHLQPLMKNIKSYLKDTGHMIRELEKQVWNQTHYLVTADVS